MTKAEIRELETLEELKLAIHMVQQRAAAADDDHEDDYRDEYGGSADVFMTPLLAAFRILKRCKARHIAAWEEYEKEHQATIDARAKEAAAAEFNRRQAAAHAAVSTAIANGDLIRPKQCERCPTTADNVIAHHHDYDRPLDVEWLCRPCHGKHHAENGPAV